MGSLGIVVQGGRGSAGSRLGLPHPLGGSRADLEDSGKADLEGSGKAGTKKRRSQELRKETWRPRSWSEKTETEGQGEGIPLYRERADIPTESCEIRNWEEKKAEPSRGAPPFPPVSTGLAAGRSVSRAFQLPANPAPPPSSSDSALFHPPADSAQARRTGAGRAAGTLRGGVR